MSISIPVSFKAYLASRFSRRFEMQGVAADLEAAGHRCVSRWIFEEFEDPAIAAQNAHRDLIDVAASDALIAFTEAPRSCNSRGGRHTEFGYALGLGKAVLLVGPRENIFYTLPDIAVFTDWPSALRTLQPTLAIAA